jgi:hypothetical protein
MSAELSTEQGALVRILLEEAYAEFKYPKDNYYASFGGHLLRTPGYRAV